jgi:hypothetical protein
MQSMGDVFGAYGDDYLVGCEPLFLARSIHEECLMLTPERQPDVLRQWVTMAGSLGLPIDLSSDLEHLSSGERAATYLTLIAAVAETRTLSGLKILTVNFEESLSAERVASIRSLWSNLLCAPQVFHLTEVGPSRWL